MSSLLIKPIEQEGFVKTDNNDTLLFTKFSQIFEWEARYFKG